MDGPLDGFGVGSMGAVAGRVRGRQLPEPQLGRAPSVPQFIVPSVRAAKPVVSCQPCAAIIERIIRAHMREIRYCYEQSLQRNSRLEGELMLTLRIAKRGGAPTEVAAESAMPAADLERCAERRMSRWVFPELPHDSKANFPVRLRRL
jgi:hypothetical protein